MRRAPIALSRRLLCAARGRVRSRARRDESNHRTELLTLLARESYFERSTLTLASGRSSNYYIDCKRTLYLPRGAYLAGELMLELVLAEGIEQIGGMAAGALPVTDALIAAAHRSRRQLARLLRAQGDEAARPAATDRGRVPNASSGRR